VATLRLWARVAARAAYALAAAWLAMKGADAIAGILASQGLNEFADYVARARPLAALAAAATVRLAPAALVLGLASLLATADTKVLAAMLAASGAAAAYSLGDPGVGRALWPRGRMILKGQFVLIMSYAAPPVAVMGAAWLVYNWLDWVPEARGELSTVMEIFSQTILYKIVMAGLALGVAYKAVAHGVELAAAAYYGPTYASAVLEAERRLETRSVLYFRGAQYPVLEWAASWLLALLFAPMVYDPISEIIVRAVGEVLAPVYAALAATAVSIIIGWTILRLVARALVKGPTLASLLNPKPAAPVALAILVVGGLAAAYLIAGNDPLPVLYAALTGEPAGPDPAAEILNAAPGEDYYRALVRLIELIVRLFWG